MTDDAVARPERRRRLGYRADVDGMRAVAVLAVLLFHAGLGLPGGFVGVDVFFVISGFLITSIVMREVEACTFSYLGFWERRARRLVPAMFVVVVATVLLGYLILLPHDFKELGQSVCAQAVAAANFYFYRESGYFAGPSEIKPLLHTWSLAVEEQFYFLMPGLLILAHRVLPRRVPTVLVVTLIASLVWCVYSTPVFQDAAFYLLPARAWEMLLGGVVALAGDLKWLKRPAAELVSLAGLITVVASILFYEQGTPFPGSWAILPCLGTAAMIAGNSVHATVTSRLLSWRPVVFIGLISYSLYLWHWPLFAFANYMTPGELPEWLALSLITASLAMGVLSWRYVETPFRNKSLLPTRMRVLGAAAAGLALLAGVGALLHVNNGVRSRFGDDVLQLADARQDRNPQRRLHHDLRGSALVESPRLLTGTVGSDPQLIVVGDSHGDAIVPGIVDLCKKQNVPMVAFTRSDTLPLCFTGTPRDNAEKTFYDSAAAYIRDSTATHVLLIARWSEYGERLHRQDLAETVNRLRELRKTVWLVRQVPEPAADVPRHLALNALWGMDNIRIQRSVSEYRTSQVSVKRLLNSVSGDGVRVVDASRNFFCSSDLAVLQIDGHPLYFDDNHLSTRGAMFAASCFKPIIDSITDPQR